MGHYFFHFSGDGPRINDQEGRELATLDLAISAALVEARAMICHEAITGTIRLDWWIDVEDECGKAVHHLLLADAVVIVRPKGTS